MIKANQLIIGWLFLLYSNVFAFMNAVHICVKNTANKKSIVILIIISIIAVPKNVSQHNQTT